MPRRILCTSVLVAQLLFGCTAADVDPASTVSDVRSIKVMSYNIHYGLGTDGKTDLDRIAAIISAEQPDVAGLQEISNKAMAEELGRLTGMQAVFGPSKGSDEAYGDAVLCRHPFRWVANHPIPSASSSRYQAMAIDVDISDVFGEGTVVRFVNTHFDWLDSLGSQEARLAAIEVIERGFRAGSDLPTILTGDLNAVPGSMPLTRLSEKGWRYEDLGRDQLTWEATDPDRQIDYVLVAPARAWRILSTEVLDQPLASDHLPIVMSLSLSPR